LDILAPAVAAGALAVGTVEVPAIHLPADEQRSVTLAQALMRCLRMFPAVAAWFDYSGAVPVLNIGAGAGADWMDEPELRRTMLTEAQSGSPPDGVVLEIETTGEFNGSTYRKVDVQAAGDTADGKRVLYIPLDLQGAGGSVTSSSLKVVTTSPFVSSSVGIFAFTRHVSISAFSPAPSISFIGTDVMRGSSPDRDASFSSK
jgi:hypothetical protein